LHKSRNAYETVEILERVALPWILALAKARARRRYPQRSRPSEQRRPAPKATQPFGREAEGASGRVARSLQPAKGDAPHSPLAIRPFCLYARPIPVFQRSHMSFLAFFFIVISLLSFVVAQLILKRAMVATRTTGFRNVQFVWKVTAGIILMTISFFLTLGLLQRFDLSYLYPFQGLSVIFIALMAAVVLKEKLNMRLAVGALLISAGIVLVSMS
jgi:uncharacterized membrane protein